MVKTREMMQNIEVEHMRNGDGKVLQNLILDKSDMAKHSRMFAKLTIKKGCSIGQRQLPIT
ncbi:MAG: hypothetical protein K6G51_07735 [Sphaerochaetaceae bacterium]|nr:hypothetical protein [Sphaerochaetaceae bacterium]